jgi:hypothetical protein
MRSEPARWCAKCHLRVAPYDLRTVYNSTTYHQHCFLMVVREEANREKLQGAEAQLAKAARRSSG